MANVSHNNNNNHINVDPCLICFAINELEYTRVGIVVGVVEATTRGNKSRIILADDDIRTVVICAPFEIMIIYKEQQPLYELYKAKAIL